MKNCFERNEKTEGKNVGNVGKLILLSASQERPNYLLTRQNGLLLLRNKNVVHNKNKAYFVMLLKLVFLGRHFRLEVDKPLFVLQNYHKRTLSTVNLKVRESQFDYFLMNIF